MSIVEVSIHKSSTMVLSELNSCSWLKHVVHVVAKARCGEVRGGVIPGTHGDSFEDGPAWLVNKMEYSVVQSAMSICRRTVLA